MATKNFAKLKRNTRKKLQRKCNTSKTFESLKDAWKEEHENRKNGTSNGTTQPFQCDVCNKYHIGSNSQRRLTYKFAVIKHSLKRVGS